MLVKYLVESQIWDIVYISKFFILNSFLMLAQILVCFDLRLVYSL